MISAINSSQQLSSIIPIKSSKKPSFQAMSSQQIMDANQSQKSKANFKSKRELIEWGIVGGCGLVGWVASALGLNTLELIGYISCGVLFVSKIAQFADNHMDH